MKKKSIVVVLIALLITIAVLVTIVVFKNNDLQKGKVEIKNTIKYNIEGDDLLYKIHKYNYYEIGVATDEDELEELLEDYSYIATRDDEDDMNYKKNNYFLIAFSDGGCMYNLKPTDYKIENKEITFYVKEKVTCGVCAESVFIYAIPVSKKVTDKYDVDVEFKTSGESNCNDDPVVAKKPLLYLYPQQKTNVSVEFSNPNSITTSYPKYNNGWNVIAYPNGDLYDADNKYYYGLYWEEMTNAKIDFKEGFYVTKDNAINFLEEKLSIIGLNEKESNEFIMYWLPILERNEQSLVYFELTDELEQNNKLLIEPKPDSLLRIRIHIKKVDSKVDIKEQKLPTFERRGFVAVEWGGTNQ